MPERRFRTGGTTTAARSIPCPTENPNPDRSGQARLLHPRYNPAIALLRVPIECALHRVPGCQSGKAIRAMWRRSITAPFAVRNFRRPSDASKRRKETFRDDSVRLTNRLAEPESDLVAAQLVLACAPQPLAITLFNRLAATCAKRCNGAKVVMVEWWQLYRSRRELLTLGAIELADLGLTRTDAIIEARRPFWKRIDGDPTRVRI